MIERRCRGRRGCVAAVAVALLTVPSLASAGDVEDLRSQIEALKVKLSKLEADKSRQRRIASAASVDAGDKPKSWKLPGSNTSMQIGGYAKLDILYDFNGFLGDQLAINGVPTRGSAPANRDGNFRLHARQSRLWLKTWTPTDWGELATHIEGDFFRDNGGNPVFRLRHAYGSLGPVLAGQNWSTFMPIWYIQETLDFTGPAGQIFNRQAMLRYTHRLFRGLHAILAVEDPGGLGTAGPATTGAFAGAATSGPNFMPDIIAALHYRWSAGGLYLSGIVRGLEVNDGAGGAAVGPGFHDRAIGWGIALAGKYVVTQRLDLGGGIVYGEGLAKYIIGIDVDAVVNGSNAGVSLDPVETLGAFGWVRYRWTNTVRTNVVLGYSRQDVSGDTTGGKAVVAAGTDAWNWTVHANVIWSPVPQVNFGAEYIYVFRSVYNGPNGIGNRLQIGMQYKF